VKPIYRAMDSLSSLVNKFLGWLAGLLIALCALALLFQVFYRFVIIKFFSFSFPFTEEFARYALIWASYLCLGVCLKEGSQASINFLYDRLGGMPKLILYLVTRIFMIIFLAVAIYYGTIIVDNNSIFKSATLGIPGTYLFSAPVVGCILMGYETITEIIGVLSGELKPFGAGGWDVQEESIGINIDESASGFASDGDASRK
jgi:C4-dicarboxylate transporter DctQ subunit